MIPIQETIEFAEFAESGPSYNTRGDYVFAEAAALAMAERRRKDAPAPVPSKARAKKAAPKESAPPRVKPPARIFHAEVYGTRQQKYAALREGTVNGIDWREIHPNAPFYLFKPQDQTHRAEYETGWKITDVMPVNVLGFQTHRDHFAIAFDESVLRARIAALRDTKITDEKLRERYRLADNRDWQLAKARRKLQNDADWESAIIRFQYHPFDARYCYFNEVATERPRRELTRSVLNKDNLTLNITRQTRAAFWRHALVSNAPTPAVFAEIKDGSTVFPLYLYPETAKMEPEKERKANLSPQFMAELTARIGTQPSPEAVFHYAYGVFHAPAYRSRYAEFLKIDFPRLPLPPNRAAFDAAAEVGAKLVALHLLEAPSLQNTGVGFPVAGDHRVLKMKAEKRYQPPLSDGTPGRVNLNETEYFANVPPEAWAFRVGGYQPAQKWLDDRADRLLTEEDIRHYRRLSAALRETAALLPSADAAFALIVDLQGTGE